ncbi:TIGR00730 family Rossman fold protein [Myxococcota bacterium]|nr:TIGR00730 family Rossman fold protein [Myxococcota bacterium]
MSLTSEVMMKKLRRVCVFCGSNSGDDPAFVAAARDLGILLAKRGIGLVFGGGKVGLMGTVADAALAAGGQVLGVIPEKLRAKEIAHEELTELFVVDSMHARKAMMAQLSDAFIALPGGFGTLDETFEILTWALLKYHAKPVGLVNVNGYYDGLLGFLGHAVDRGFIHPDHRALLWSAPTAEELLGLLETSPVSLEPVRPSVKP